AHDSVTVLAQTCSEGLSVDNNLALVVAKLWLERFMKTNRFRSDNVHEGAALDSRKDHGIDLLGIFFLAQHHPAPRPTQTFVRRGRNELGMWNRARMLPSRNQTGNGCDIYEQ